MSIADDVLADLKSRIEKTIEDLKRDLSKVRTGRANPAILEGVKVDYYGTPTPLNGVANINVVDARLIVVKPWDRSSIPAIEKGIHHAEIGINPMNDGEVVRLVFPPLTEERRRELGKVVKNKGEDHKVAIRNERRDAKEMLDQYVEEGELPEDDGKRAQEKVQALVDAGVKTVDEIVARKTADLMQV
jgi:ribosome recycling factor